MHSVYTHTEPALKIYHDLTNIHKPLEMGKHARASLIYLLSKDCNLNREINEMGR